MQMYIHILPVSALRRIRPQTTLHHGQKEIFPHKKERPEKVSPEKIYGYAGYTDYSIGLSRQEPSSLSTPTTTQRAVWPKPEQVDSVSR